MAQCVLWNLVAETGFSNTAVLGFIGHRGQISIEPQMGLATSYLAEATWVWAHSPSGAPCSSRQHGVEGHLHPEVIACVPDVHGCPVGSSPKGKSGWWGDCLSVGSFRVVRGVSENPFCAYHGRFVSWHPNIIC